MSNNYEQLYVLSREVPDVEPMGPADLSLNENLRVFNIDVNADINPTSAVLYKDSLATYSIIFKLIDNDKYFILNKNIDLEIFIDDIKIPEECYTIRDRYRGTIYLDLKSILFNIEKLYVLTENSYTSADTEYITHFFKIVLHSETTYGIYDKTITVPFTLIGGYDDGSQTELTRRDLQISTTIATPTISNPRWSAEWKNK